MKALWPSSVVRSDHFNQFLSPSFSFDSSFFVCPCWEQMTRHSLRPLLVSSPSSPLLLLLHYHFFVSCLLSSRRCGLRPASAAIRHLYAPDDERWARTTERLIALADMLLYRCISFSLLSFSFGLSFLLDEQVETRETKVVLSQLVFKALRMMIMYSDNRVTHYIDLLSAAEPSHLSRWRLRLPSFILSFFRLRILSLLLARSFSCPGQNVSLFFL